MQVYDVLILIHLNVTSLKDMTITPEEIIEIACASLDLSTMKVQSEFHSYIKPMKKPKLSPHCVKTTGIKQDMVNKSQDFSKVFESFCKWKSEWTDKKSIFATLDGRELTQVLPNQIIMSKTGDIPKDMKQWVDLRRTFDKVTGLNSRDKSLEDLLKHLQVQPTVASPSNGKDFCSNLVKLAAALAKQTVFQPVI